MNDAGQITRARGFAIAYLVAIVMIVLAATLGWGRIWAVIYEVPMADKLAHVILLGGLTLAADVLAGRRRIGGVVPSVGVALLVIATIDECLQMLVPTRTFDLLDLAGNYLGIIGASLILAYGSYRESRTSES